MEKNKTTKYLKYAIGEIILVMIGILLALQVNNWNNNRKERKLEVNILEDLKVEFNANKNDALRIMATHISTVTAMHNIQSDIEKGHYNQVSANTLLTKLLNMPYYTPKPGASENLMNSGNLNILSNEELRNQLTLWSGVVDELHDDEEDGLHHTRNIIIPFLTNNYPIINLENLYFEPYNQTILKDLKLDTMVANKNEYKLIDLEALYNHPTFQNHVALKKIFGINGAAECKPVVEAAEAIAKLIDSELLKLKQD